MKIDCKPFEEKMKKTISVYQSQLDTIRAGRANPAVLNGIMVEYYGTPTAINQMAEVKVADARTVTITPWDMTTVKTIEKEILASDIGITPNNDGKSLRLNFPPLTEERRKELVKTVKKYSEEAKVQVRNVRRDAMDDFKKKQKASEITEDDLKGIEKDIQNLTDKYVKNVDTAVANKEKEILEV